MRLVRYKIQTSAELGAAMHWNDQSTDPGAQIMRYTVMKHWQECTAACRQ